MKLRSGGITLEVLDPADAQRLLNAGYVKVDEQPELLPAAALPEQPAAQPPAKRSSTKERGK
jgi:hypothetical protein